MIIEIAAQKENADLMTNLKQFHDLCKEIKPKGGVEASEEVREKMLVEEGN
jgi:hypothetical protein